MGSRISSGTLAPGSRYFSRSPYLPSRPSMYSFFFLLLSWADCLFRIFLRIFFRILSSYWLGHSFGRGKAGVKGLDAAKHAGSVLGSTPWRDFTLVRGSWVGRLTPSFASSFFSSSLRTSSWKDCWADCWGWEKDRPVMVCKHREQSRLYNSGPDTWGLAVGPTHPIESGLQIPPSRLQSGAGPGTTQLAPPVVVFEQGSVTQSGPQGLADGPCCCSPVKMRAGRSEGAKSWAICAPLRTGNTVLRLTWFL